MVGNIPSLFPSQLDCVGSGPFWAESGPFWRSHSQPPNQWLETTSRKPHSLSLLFCPSHTSARETAAPPWAAHSNPYPKPWLFTTFPVVFLFVPPGRQERHTHTPLFWKVKHLRRLEFQARKQLFYTLFKTMLVSEVETKTSWSYIDINSLHPLGFNISIHYKQCFLKCPPCKHLTVVSLKQMKAIIKQWNIQLHMIHHVSSILNSRYKAILGNIFVLFYFMLWRYLFFFFDALQVSWNWISLSWVIIRKTLDLFSCVILCVTEQKEKKMWTKGSRTIYSWLRNMQ